MHAANLTATARATGGCSGPGLAAVLGTLRYTLLWEELFIPPGVTVFAGGVIFIKGAGTSGIFPNTPAEAATEGYRERAGRLQQNVLHRCADPAQILHSVTVLCALFSSAARS